MDRIQHSSATSDHQFTEGDPGNGVPATTVTAVHMNGVQNELVHIIEEAGLTPDESVHTQVLQALGELFQAKGSESTTPVVEALVSDAVSGVLNLNLGTRATSVVVVVKGNSSTALTLRLAGTVPSGSTVTVFNWNPGALTVALASGTLTGNSGTLALGDTAFLWKDTASTSWWLAVLPTRGTVASLIQTAVQAEANSRSSADTALQQNLNQEASSRATGDSNLGQEIAGVDYRATLWATAEEFGSVLSQYTQNSENLALTLPVESDKVYRLDGSVFWTYGTGEPAPPTTVALLVYDESDALLGFFGTGKLAQPAVSTGTANELKGSFPFILKVAGHTSLKLKVWGLVGTGGGATYKAAVTALLQELAG